MSKMKNIDGQVKFKEAIEKYTRAAESLLELLPLYKDEKVQQFIKDKMEEYLKRTDYLKKN